MVVWRCVQEEEQWLEWQTLVSGDHRPIIVSPVSPVSSVVLCSVPSINQYQLSPVWTGDCEAEWVVIARFNDCSRPSPHQTWSPPVWREYTEMIMQPLVKQDEQNVSDDHDQNHYNHHHHHDQYRLCCDSSREVYQGRHKTFQSIDFLDILPRLFTAAAPPLQCPLLTDPSHQSQQPEVSRICEEKSK